MKGLLLKDLYLTKNNRRLLYIICFLAAMFLITGMDFTFIIGYFTMFAAMLALTTISYDEQEKSSAFLMTLPISRRTYVAEKYLFSFLFSLAGWLLSFILVAVATRTSGLPSLLFQSFLYLDLSLLMLLLLLPIQLKFGADISRIIIVCVALGIVVAGSLLGKAAAYFHMDLFLLKEKILSLGQPTLIIILILLHLLCLGVSYGLSVRFTCKREY